MLTFGTFAFDYDDDNDNNYFSNMHFSKSVFPVDKILNTLSNSPPTQEILEVEEYLCIYLCKIFTI